MDIKSIEEIISRIESYLSEAQSIYFKNEKFIGIYQSDRLNNMGLDNCVGNADFYSFMRAIYDNDMEKAKKALDYSDRYVEDTFKKIDAYKPIPICTWTGVDADLWLPLGYACDAINELKIFFEQELRRDETDPNLKSVLLKLTKLGIHYFCDHEQTFTDDVKDALNEMTIALKSNNDIAYNEKVHDFWFNGEDIIYGDKPYFIIGACNNMYKQNNLNSEKNLSKSSYNSVIHILLGMVERIENKMEQAKKTPNMQELYDHFLSLFEKNIDKDNFVVNIEQGRLNREGNVTPYRCFVIRSKKANSYIASCIIGKDAIGNFELTNRIPLCGESCAHFTFDEAERIIKNTIKFICGD